MKRTSFLLATLTAIALLSCSQFDSPNSPAEDTDYQPPKALQKASTGATISAAGSKTVSCSGSMSISGSSGCSSTATCNFTSVPAGSINTSYQFVGSGPSGNSFGIDYAEIQCGTYILTPFYPFSYANMSTTAFAGKPANVTCYIRFCGQCLGTGCKLSITNITGYQTYQ